MIVSPTRPTRKPDAEALSALMDKWPSSWAGVREDEAPGRRLVSEVRPFLAHLIEQDLSAKTVRRHLDNLWAIAGEIIRALNDEPALRRRSARRLLLDAIDLGEAPWLHASEDQQRSADATARKLLKFLRQKE